MLKRKKKRKKKESPTAAPAPRFNDTLLAARNFGLQTDLKLLLTNTFVLQTLLLYGPFARFDPTETALLEPYFFKTITSVDNTLQFVIKRVVAKCDNVLFKFLINRAILQIVVTCCRSF